MAKLSDLMINAPPRQVEVTMPPLPPDFGREGDNEYLLENFHVTLADASHNDMQREDAAIIPELVQGWTLKRYGPGWLIEAVDYSPDACREVLALPVLGKALANAVRNQWAEDQESLARTFDKYAALAASLSRDVPLDVPELSPSTQHSVESLISSVAARRLLGNIGRLRPIGRSSESLDEPLDLAKDRSYLHVWGAAVLGGALTNADRIIDWLAKLL